MGFRWTKRPLNECRDCGKRWFPRGQNLSPRCPNRRCDSTDIDLSSTIFLEDLAELLVTVVRGIWWLVVLPFRLVWLALQFGYRVVTKTYDRLAHRYGNVEVVDETASGQSADVLAVALFAVWKLVSSGFLWLYSVKDDLLAVGKRRVNPVAMFAKLLVICVLAVVLVGGSILLVRKWTRGD